jgi:proteasome beta subunit
MAGAAGPCLEMIKLFQVEMEPYHTIEGETLALDGKANKLAQMVNKTFRQPFMGSLLFLFLLATICACSRAASLSMT